MAYRNGGGTGIRKFKKKAAVIATCAETRKGHIIDLVDSDDGGSGRVQNSIRPSIDMPGQSFLSDVIDIRLETEIGYAADVKRVPSHENVRVLPELDVSKPNTFALFEFGPVPRSNFLRIDRGAEDVRAVLGIGNPTCRGGIKDRVTPRLNVERESGIVNVSGGGLETPVVAFIEINQVEEDDDFGRGEEWALKVNARGGRVLGVAGVLAGQELQVGRSEIERVNNAAVKSSVGPRGDVVDTRSPGDVLNRRFDTDVGAFVFIELTDPMGKTRREDERTGEFDLSRGIRLRFIPKADALGIKLADGRHCALREMWRATWS